MKKPGKYIVAIAACIFIVFAGVMLWGWNTPQARAGRSLEQADKYLAQRNFTQAAQEFKNSLQVHPDPAIELTLGTTLARAGKREEALQTVRKVAQRDDKTGITAKRILGKMERDPSWGLRQGNEGLLPKR